MLAFLNHYLWAFIRFLQKPKDEAAQVPFSGKWKQLIALLLLEIPVMILIMLLIYALEFLGLFDTDSHKMEELMQSMPTGLLLLFGVLIVPFLEEFIFRFFLRFERNYFLHLWISISHWGKGDLSQKMKDAKLEWQRYFAYPFYASAVAFALVHLTNFEWSPVLLVLAPILVLPQFIAGLITGFLRIRFGFLWGFAFHAIHNALFLAIPLLSDTDEKIKIQEDREEYFLEIESASIFSFDKTIDLGPNEVKFSNVPLAEIIAQLKNVPPYYILSQDKNFSQHHYNVHFKSEALDDSLVRVHTLGHLEKNLKFSTQNYRKDTFTYRLMVKNEEKLNEHRCPSDENRLKVTESSNSYQLSYYTLNDLADFLSRKRAGIFEYEDDSEEKFCINIPKNDFKAVLLEEYGIQMRREAVNLSCWQIRPHQK